MGRKYGKTDSSRYHGERERQMALHRTSHRNRRGHRALTITRKAQRLIKRIKGSALEVVA